LKRRIFLFLLLSVLLLCSCQGQNNDAAEAAGKNFLKELSQKNFDKAYDLLSSSAQEQISREDFVRRYSSVFSDLEIEEFRAGAATLAVEAQLYTRYSYQGAYSSALCGELTYDYDMELYYENGSWKVEWTPALLFPMMGWGDEIRFSYETASRGEIFASGKVVAANEPGITIYANPENIEDIAVFSAQLAPYIGMTSGEIQEKVEKASPYLAVLRAYPTDEIDSYTINAVAAIPGAGVDSKSFTIFRSYPYGESLFHVVGYVGKISEEKLAAVEGTEEAVYYDEDSLIGLSGIESEYESTLRGLDGFSVYVNSSDGLRKATLFSRPAEDGKDVHLTIDPDFQQYAYDLMEFFLREGQTGSIVLSDPTTGALRIMLSYPSYDPNKLSRGLSSAEYSTLMADTSYPLLNRATQGLYPPGSILKPFTAIIGLETGEIKADTVFPGKIEDNQWTPADPKWNWVYPPITRVRSSASDVCNLYNSLMKSDNIFFAWTAMEVGEERFVDFLHRLGFDQELDFDLGVAVSQTKNADTELNIKYIADMGYGQGELLVTPLQASMLYSILGNEGTLMQPYLVDSLYTTDGRDYQLVSQTEPAVLSDQLVDPYILRVINPMMEAVFERGGTARMAYPPYTCAGKTGTAERSKTTDVSWLTLYKSERPKDLVSVVLIEGPTGNGDSKMEITRGILRYDNDLRKGAAEE
jgi:cell division protein FtsI/penicillin-binding protein 2